MKIATLLACSLVIGPVAAHARSKRALSALPRAVGRTAENMVTFKDRNLAFHQWALIAASLANAGSSIDLYYRCPTCTERDRFFLGSRPSAGRLIGIELLGGMGYSAIQQVSWESSYNEKSSREWRTLARWAPTIVPVAGYTWCVFHNVRIPSDGSRN